MVFIVLHTPRPLPLTTKMGRSFVRYSRKSLATSDATDDEHLKSKKIKKRISARGNTVLTGLVEVKGKLENHTQLRVEK